MTAHDTQLWQIPPTMGEHVHDGVYPYGHWMFRTWAIRKRDGKQFSCPCVYSDYDKEINPGPMFDALILTIFNNASEVITDMAEGLFDSLLDEDGRRLADDTDVDDDEEGDDGD